MGFAHNVKLLSLKIWGDSMGERLLTARDFVTMLYQEQDL